MTLTPEANVLVACARWFVGTADVGDVYSAASRVSNWSHLIDTAAWHGVRPLLYSALDGCDKKPAPAEVVEELKRQVKAIAHHNLMVTACLREAIDVLDRHQIRMLTFKGPTLSVAAYGGLALREFADIDLLIHRNDAAKALEALTGAGFAVDSGLHSSLRSRGLLSTESEIVLTHAATGTHVDLHTELLLNYYPFRFPFEDLWMRRAEQQLAGRPMAVFSNEDFLLYSCLHGAKHVWSSFGWICDVALLINSRGPLEWQATLALARDRKATHILFSGLLLAADLLKVNNPESVLSAARADPRATSLAAQAARRLFSRPPGPLPRWESFRYNVQLLNTPRQKLRYWASNLLNPTEAEFRAVALPRPLFFLNYPFRVIRLCGKYLSLGMSSLRRTKQRSTMS